jgi:hypothetical protein
MLCSAPRIPDIDFEPVRDKVEHVLENVGGINIPPTFIPYIRRVMQGERIDPPYAQMLLKAIRQEHLAVRLELFESYLLLGIGHPVYTESDEAWRAIVAAVECAAYQPRHLTKLGCRRLPLIPPWKGHFLFASETAKLWMPYLQIEQ